MTKHAHVLGLSFFLFKDTRNIHFTASCNTGWEIHAKYLFQSISPELDFTGHLLITRCRVMPPCASQSLPDKLPDSGGVRARVTSAPLIGHKDLPRRNLVALRTSSPGLQAGPVSLGSECALHSCRVALNTRVVMRQPGNRWAGGCGEARG